MHVLGQYLYVYLHVQSCILMSVVHATVGGVCWCVIVVAGCVLFM
jgi:hypothetical protein